MLKGVLNQNTMRFFVRYESDVSYETVEDMTQSYVSVVYGILEKNRTMLCKTTDRKQNRLVSKCVEDISEHCLRRNFDQISYVSKSNLNRIKCKHTLSILTKFRNLGLLAPTPNILLDTFLGAGLFTCLANNKFQHNPEIISSKTCSRQDIICLVAVNYRVKDIVIGPGGLEFDYRAGQIGHSDVF